MYCISLGCVVCSDCGDHRNLRGLESSTFDAAEVELTLDNELESFCEGRVGCELWSKVYMVGEDGSLTET
jgi:hypothetical protein